MLVVVDEIDLEMVLTNVEGEEAKFVVWVLIVSIVIDELKGDVGVALADAVESADDGPVGIDVILVTVVEGLKGEVVSGDALTI